MTVVLKARPVLYACAGCLSYGQVARDVARFLDRRGLAEASCVDAACEDAFVVLKAKSRFPVFALDGCAKACARHWLTRHGVPPQRYFVLAQADAGASEQIAERIAANW